MAVKIRFKRMGSKKNPFYRVVVADSRSPGTAGYRRTGILQSLTKETKIDNEKAADWVAKARSHGYRPRSFEEERRDSISSKENENTGPQMMRLGIYSFQKG